MKKIRLLFLTLVALIGGVTASYADDTWTVAGSAAALNGETSWSPSNEANDMSTTDGVNFALTVTDCTLEVGVTYEFKVVKNHAWDEAYPSSNYTFTVDNTAVYTVVYTFNSETKSVNCVTSKTGEAGVVTHTYTVVGDEALLGVDWNPAATQFDMTSEDQTNFTFQFVKELAAGTYEYKVAEDHDWGVSFPSSNAQVTITEAGFYTITFSFNTETQIVDAQAVKKEVYTMDFNNTIVTSNHDFRVASNWKHIVYKYNDGYSDYWMSYSYGSDTGIDGTGALYAGQQRAGDNWDYETTYDILVTPVVSGQITIYAKKSTSGSPFVEFWSLNEDGTAKNEKIFEVTSFESNTWTAVTYNVTTPQRIGIRAQYVYLDNFTAFDAVIVPEKSINILSADPTATTGTIYWDQQANGKVLVKYTVVVTNNGEVDLTQGMEGYGVSVFNRKTNEVYFTVPVPQDLAIGEVSNPFEVSGEVETSIWPNSYSYINMDLKENLQGSAIQRAQSQYKAYEPKFIFRAAGSTSSSSLTATQAYGLISEATTKSFEIRNDGAAPLTVKSITLPEGFTSDNMPEIPTEGLVIAKYTTQALNITLPIDVNGAFSGNLVIVYLDKNAVEQTYTLPFSGNVLAAGTWFADFNNTSSTAIFPEGSVAESGIRTDYEYNSGVYDYYLKSYTSGDYSTKNNKFVTPKLHANAGDKLTFDVRSDESSSSNFNVKVYVSTDRKTWGEPVYSVTAADLTSSFQTKEIGFDAEGDYYVAFAIYGVRVDNIIGLTKVDVAHDLYVKSVSWPDASVNSGVALSKPSVDIIPLTTETAEAYTVKYVCGETVLAEGTPVALTASATSSKTFTFNWTPEVESTTTFENTKVVFDFGGGVSFETEGFNLTVVKEPEFIFTNSLPSSKYNKPTMRTADITYGKTNAAVTQNFYIYNWGTAALTVNSISLPEGFTTSVEFPLTVAAFDESDLSVSAQALDITFSATEAGVYNGNMVVTYLDGASVENTFTLGISGTKLDPSKFYATFDNASGEINWPAGSVYENGISASNGGTYSVPNYYISGTGMFITPKMTVAAGDKIAFDAKLYSSSSSYASGSVTVYAAETREDVMNAGSTTRVQLFKVSGEDAENPLTTDFQTFEATLANAGEYYIGFQLNNSVKVDEIYGLTVAPVVHDMVLVTPSIPAEGTQNAEYTASVNVQNFGLAEDEAIVTAYVKGEVVATSAAVAIPMNHKLTDTGTALSVSFVYPKAIENVPVYLEVKAGEALIASTAPVNVTFAEEIAVADQTIGTSGGVDSSTPLNMYYKKSETIALYTPEVLGLTGGEKIKSISWKGYSTKSFTSSLKVYYEWTDETTISSPVNGAYDVTGMTEAINEDNHAWAKVGSSSELGDMIVVNFATPIEYQANKSLRILVSSSASSDAGYNTFYFEKSTTTGLAYQHQSDTNLSSWSPKDLPLIHIGLEATAPTLSGTVKTSAGAGIEGATVTLKSGNGVEYSGITADDGSYSINVIQAGLDFTATVVADDYITKEFALPNMNGASVTQDVVLFKQFGLVGTMPGFNGWNNDMVMTQSTENSNIFTLEMNNVGVTAGNYEFKLRADGAWDLADGFYKPNFDNGTDAGNGYTVSGGNYQWNFATSGTYNFLFTFDLSTSTLTFERPFTLSENNTAAIADLNWVDVTVEREFKAGWNAVVLPFDLSAAEVNAAFGANSEMAVYDGDINDNGKVTVKFKKVDGDDKVMAAGYPKLIWLEAPVSGLKFTKNISANLIPETKGTTFDFVGVYTQTGNKDGDYIVQGGEFRKASASNFVRPFRAYLKLKEGQSAVRSFNFVISDGTESTEINAAEVSGLEIEGIYNLNGQKVQNMNRKGLYIINGKKVMVK